jgi:hypothetical protein
MTPKEKARELRDKMFLKIPAVYDPTNLPHFPIAKEMALIAVDEIIDSLTIKNYSDVDDYEYWKEVKHEIENL